MQRDRDPIHGEEDEKNGAQAKCRALKLLEPSATFASREFRSTGILRGTRGQDIILCTFIVILQCAFIAA